MGRNRLLDLQGPAPQPGGQAPAPSDGFAAWPHPSGQSGAGLSHFWQQVYRLALEKAQADARASGLRHLYVPSRN
jgi:hypothetical protein